MRSPPERGLPPAFKTRADLRQDNCAAGKPRLKNCNLRCRARNLCGAELVAIDGSKFKAVNRIRVGDDGTVPVRPPPPTQRRAQPLLHLPLPELSETTTSNPALKCRAIFGRPGGSAPIRTGRYRKLRCAPPHAKCIPKWWSGLCSVCRNF